MDRSFDFAALMKMYERKHKMKPVQFLSSIGGVKKRLETNIRNRKSTRLSVFDSLRNLQRSESPAPILEAKSKVEHRKMQLQKWKEEKEKKKKEASLHKKKPFVAGVPHNPLKFVPPPPPKPMPSSSGRVTRSQASRNNSENLVKKTCRTETKSKSVASSFAPKNALFHPPVLKNMNNLPTLALSKQKEKKQNVNSSEQKIKEQKSKILKEKAMKQNETRVLRSRPQSNNVPITKNYKDPVSNHSLSKSSSSSSECSNDECKIQISRTPRKSLQSKDNNVTPKNVPKSESSSEEKLRSPKLLEISVTPQQNAEEAQNRSPYVTLSRGKDNARKEVKKKMDDGLLDYDSCEMDSVEHFRRQLDSEVARMTNMCEAWEKTSHQIVLPETVQEAVLSAVGQARLLMSQKLQQFASLLSRCEHPAPGTGLVTPTDLHGFWDMVFMQIENVDMRFRKLEELRARDWCEEQPQVTARPARAAARPVRVASRPARAPSRPAPSRLKELIAAARKAQQSQSTDVQSKEDSKTIDMGFFCIHSPIKSPLQVTPSKTSLLKAVLSNEAEKSANGKSTSLAMIRASLIARGLESEQAEDEENLITFTPVNVGATPGRSILKNKPSAKKSIKTVLFNDSDTDSQNNSITSDEVCKGQKDGEAKKDLKGTPTEIRESGISSMDVENDIEKENKGRRKTRLTQQEAKNDRSPVMTRSRRKSLQTPKAGADRKRDTLKEVNGEDTETPRRSTRKSSNRDV